MIHQAEICFHTKGHRDIRDITAAVAAVASRSKIRTGTVHVFNVG